MNFSKTLIEWYLQNKRDLPWRNDNNPYSIWLSEIILQQTRVDQGLPYFLRFKKTFPTIFDLANASEDSVLKLWQGLGYYSRARNLHKTAQLIVQEYHGEFPKRFSELRHLKGVGDYTAAAIASFAYNENVAAVDGNVYRVLSRFFDVETDIATSAAKKEFTQLATELLPEGKANIFNQAIMEFGALQCVPKNPDCKHCVFNSGCLALQKKKVAQLPVKSKKSKVVQRYFNYLVFLDDAQHTVMCKRTQKGIWHNLYEFPLLETEGSIPEEAILDYIRNQTSVENEIQDIELYNPDPIVHKLSHQQLHIKFWKVSVEGTIRNGIDLESVTKLPFPIVIFNFIEKVWF